jgi:hypothetical protein|nr:MAG TPA: hypothetical protein [Caudoviricetes sp.]
MKRDDEDLEAYWEQRAMMDSLDDGDPWEVYQGDSDDSDSETFVDDNDEEYFDEDSLEWDNQDEDY